MKTIIAAAGLAGLLVAWGGSPPAQAAELEVMAGASIALGDVLGSAYYTAESDGYRLVATVSSGLDATPVRFIATLLPGQRAMLSVPRGVGEPEIRIEFNRIDNRLFVNEGSKLSRLAD